MSEHRTYGETRNCKGCRFWSEMLAYCHGGPILAYCLSPGSKAGFVSGSHSCTAWASGHDGAVDDPGSDPLRYEKGGE